MKLGRIKPPHKAHLSAKAPTSQMAPCNRPKLPSAPVPPRRTVLNSIAPDADDSSMQPRSQTHGANTQAEGIDTVIPSPNSDGDPAPALGSWNPQAEPHPVIFESGIHDSGELLQLEDYVWFQHGVTKYRDISNRLPTCVSGHVLNPVEILEISNPPHSLLGSKCCCCHSGFFVGDFAFTCYRCVSAYFLSLPIDREVASTGHSKGVLFCPNCAFSALSGDIRVAPDISL